MTITPQTNATLEEIAVDLLRYESIAVCGHVNPDGDCIGSTLGLCAALRAIGKDAHALHSGTDPLDANLSFMCGFDDMVPATEFDEPVDVFVSVDVPNDARIGEAAAAIKGKTAHTVALDHHAYPERVSDLSYTDPDAAATTLIIWKLVQHLGLSDDSPAWEDIATCCYGGLLTDTGRFLHGNTNAEALDLAAQMAHRHARIDQASISLFQSRPLASVKIDALAVDHMIDISSPNSDKRALLSWVTKQEIEELGGTYKDSDNAVNIMREIADVTICCMLKDTGRNVRGSFRSKDGTDVAAIAERFGGGGHKAAAGFTLECGMEEAIRIVEDALRAEIESVSSVDAADVSSTGSSAELGAPAR